MATSGVHLSNNFQVFISNLSQEVGLNSLESQLCSDNGIMIWHSFYTLPDSYYAYLWCAPLQHFQVFLL